MNNTSEVVSKDQPHLLAQCLLPSAVLTRDQAQALLHAEGMEMLALDMCSGLKAYEIRQLAALYDLLDASEEMRKTLHPRGLEAQRLNWGQDTRSKLTQIIGLLKAAITQERTTIALTAHQRGYPVAHLTTIQLPNLSAELAASEKTAASAQA